MDGVDEEAAVEEDGEGEEFVAAAEGEAELIMFTTEWTPPMKSFNGLELVVPWPNAPEAAVRAMRAEGRIFCLFIMLIE